MKSVMKSLRRLPGIVWGTIGLFAFFAIFAQGFIQPTNVQNILENTSILIIVSLGMTLVILAGKIDISIGSVMSLSGMMAALYLQSYETTTVFNVIVAVLIGTAVGGVFGIFNGIMIGKFNYDFWLITFASLGIAQGLTEVVSGGTIVAGFSKTFRFIGDGEIFGISVIVIIALILSVFIIFLSKRTQFGLRIYAIGDSERCALQSGINVVKTKINIFIICGLLAGFGGVLLASKTNSISPIAGKGYEFNAIAAVIVGGTSFDGGKGRVAGTVLGGLLIAIMKNGLQLIGFSSFWQQTLIGVFILMIIILDVISSYRRNIKMQRRVYKDA